MKGKLLPTLKNISKTFIFSLTSFPSAKLPENVSVPILSKNSKIQLFAPAAGKLKPICDVEDDIYSNKVIGEGFAVTPSNGRIYSPVNGEIVSIFPTLHAIGIRDEYNNDYLLHMGIDTVDLNGHGFKSFIKKHQKIKVGELLAIMDLEYISKRDKITDIIFVAPSDRVSSFDLFSKERVSANDEVAILN